MSYISRRRPILVPSLPSGAQDDAWEDVTESFAGGKEHMEVRERIHSGPFTLFSTMYAIECMAPEMDAVCGEVRDFLDIPLPPTQPELQVIFTMEHLIYCEMSYLYSHTLPQTVLSCVYTQSAVDASRLQLFSYLRLQMATMDFVVNPIADE